jgi:hypothetical protein
MSGALATSCFYLHWQMILARSWSLCGCVFPRDCDLVFSFFLLVLMLGVYYGCNWHGDRYRRSDTYAAVCLPYRGDRFVDGKKSQSVRESQPLDAIWACGRMDRRRERAQASPVPRGRGFPVPASCDDPCDRTPRTHPAAPPVPGFRTKNIPEIQPPSDAYSSRLPPCTSSSPPSLSIPCLNSS